VEPLKLPSDIISSTDIARLIRELNGLNDFFVGAKARATGTSIQPPKITRQLNHLTLENKVNLMDDNSRNGLIKNLELIRKNAPNIHISFAAEPAPRALEKILIWLRENIHSQTLLQVGLQPSIAAGCIVRTPNKVFDMSMRNNMKKQAPYLMKLIKGAQNG
jgi:hypothetical protein